MVKRWENQVDFILSLLPENNKEAGLISITNVQDLCTVLEIVYDWGKRKRDRDLLIEELTHAGLIEWDDYAHIYSALFVLVYVCLFKEIEISDEIIKHLIYQSF